MVKVSVFVSLHIQSECGKMWENEDQNNSEYGHFNYFRKKLHLKCLTKFWMRL